MRHARVSKRTFYEHFADKEECVLALYAAVGDHVLGRIEEAVRTDGPWRDRVRAATCAYLSELAAEPALTWTFVVEIQAAGPRALAARRAVHRRFAEHVRRLVDEAAAGEPAIAPLSPALATAVTGGINELVLEAVEDGRTQALGELAGAASELIVAVATARVATG